MELKDMILETLNELSTPHQSQEKSTNTQATHPNIPQGDTPSLIATRAIPQQNTPNLNIREEYEFLELLQERLLVLFEGLNAPQNKELESRLNITINFLEYQLSVLQRRMEELKR